MHAAEEAALLLVQRALLVSPTSSTWSPVVRGLQRARPPRTQDKSCTACEARPEQESAHLWKTPCSSALQASFSGHGMLCMRTYRHCDMRTASHASASSRRTLCRATPSLGGACVSPGAPHAARERSTRPRSTSSASAPAFNPDLRVSVRVTGKSLRTCTDHVTSSASAPALEPVGGGEGGGQGGGDLRGL